MSTVSLEAEYNPANGLMTASVDGNHHRTTYLYDPLGRIRQVTYPDQHTVNVAYDDIQNTVTVTNELGVQTRTRWNALGWKMEQGLFDAWRKPTPRGT